jgi:hypothetical protein
MDRDMAQSGSALVWGTRGRRFKSGYPDVMGVAHGERLQELFGLRPSRPGVRAPGIGQGVVGSSPTIHTPVGIRPDEEPGSKSGSR